MNLSVSASSLRIRPSVTFTSIQHRKTERVYIATAQGKSVREAILGKNVDDVDKAQQIDIDRLFSYIQQLQDKVETLSAELVQAEARDRNRMVAVRTMIQEAGMKQNSSYLKQPEQQQGLSSFIPNDVEEDEEPWAAYRNSFTTVMSQGYLQAVEQLRDSLMASEWQLNLRPMALLMGVSRFEAFCAENKIEIEYDVISELYENPLNLEVIKDPYTRMQARSFIMQADNEQRLVCFQWCTVEAQKMAQQFSEAEFISKLLPDPLEHGVLDSLRKIAIPVSKMMGVK